MSNEANAINLPVAVVIASIECWAQIVGQTGNSVANLLQTIAAISANKFGLAAMQTTDDGNDQCDEENDEEETPQDSPAQSKKTKKGKLREPIGFHMPPNMEN